MVNGTLISSGKIGLFPILRVTAPTLSTIDIYFGSVIVSSCTLVGEETTHDFEVYKTGTYTVTSTRGTETKSQNVLVEMTAVYEITILYSFTLTYHFASSSELNNFSLSVPSTSSITTCTYSGCDCLKMYDGKTDSICSFSTKTNFKTLYPNNDCYRTKMKYLITKNSGFMRTRMEVRTNSSTVIIRMINDTTSTWLKYLPYQTTGFIIDVDGSIKYKTSIVSVGAWHTIEAIIDDDNHMKIYSDDTLLYTETSHEYKYIPSVYYPLQDSWWNTTFQSYVDYLIYDFK